MKPITINWISIDEKIPENGIDVLTYSPMSDGGIGTVINSHNDGIFRFLESEKENKFPITHWAYLPDDPDTNIKRKYFSATEINIERIPSVLCKTNHPYDTPEMIMEKLNITVNFIGNGGTEEISNDEIIEILWNKLSEI